MLSYGNCAHVIDEIRANVIRAAVKKYWRLNTANSDPNKDDHPHILMRENLSTKYWIVKISDPKKKPEGNKAE